MVVMCRRLPHPGAGSGACGGTWSLGAMAALQVKEDELLMQGKSSRRQARKEQLRPESEAEVQAPVVEVLGRW